MIFALQPELIEELLELRPISRTDFGSLFLAASDPMIWEQHPQSDRYKRDVFQKYFDSALASKGAFIILEKSTGEVIGSSRYYDIDPALQFAKIGYTFLARNFWGGPYNGELKKLMLKHAFRFVPSVLFEVGEKNLRSRRALEKIGAKYLEQKNIEGESSVIYRISR